MDYSAANSSLWNIVIQFGIIAGALLFANILRRSIPFIRRTLMPTAVLAGFILLVLRNTGVLKLDADLLEMITYHGIALGFIALSLRVSGGSDRSSGAVGAKSGALIVSTYLIQGIAGLIITLILGYTVMPGLFKASGILLPMGYGQGPGQANNIGGAYEALGFVGGRSFGLSIAAAGYLAACIVGVIILNVLVRRGKYKYVGSNFEDLGSVAVGDFQDKGEIPISESIDKFSIQIALVLICYFVTYLVTWGMTAGLTAIAPGAAATLNSLLWGFNFIIAAVVAILLKTLFKGLRKAKLMNHQYQNNYLLSRISGLAFDLMIVAGIASIEISDLSGLWLPFILLCVAGTVITYYYLKVICKKIYGDYYYEALMSMYGMLTGTISSGVLLLRELDPTFKTPAANNLILGSSFGIAFGIPVLILVGFAPKSDLDTWITLGLCSLYFAVLLVFMTRLGKKKQSPSA
ncbi:MAG: sodium:glutamate symporter [Clostridia bacterium]|nr:sodium:glutamate symporter [Clostridia bacterium]